MKEKIVIYTDGGCWPNPGVGGWGAVIQDNGNLTELTGGENPSTNNRMELMGPIAALEFIQEKSKIVLYSDSQYVVNGINDWIHSWMKNGWKGAKKKRIVNRELWERLHELRKKHKVEFKWIRGHSGIVGNERADELSEAGALKIGAKVYDIQKYKNL